MIANREERRRLVLPVMVLTAWVAVLSSCGENPSAAPSTTTIVLARVGEVQITADDFTSEIERRTNRGQPVPEREKLLQEMVDRQLFITRAKKAGIDSDPEVKRLLENVLIGQLRERELEAKLRGVEVTEDELRQAYEAKLSEFTKPAKVRLAFLYQKTSPKMSETKRAEQRERLVEAREKALAMPARGGRGPAATGFASLAVDYSEDQISRYRGGDMGWLDLGKLSYRWPAVVLEVGYALEKGQVSDVLETEDGYYLVMKSDKRDSSVIPFEKAAPSLRRELLAERRSAVEGAFLAENARQAEVEINEQALASLQVSYDPPVAQNREPLPPAGPGSSVSTK